MSIPGAPESSSKAYTFLFTKQLLCVLMQMYAYNI